MRPVLFFVPLVHLPVYSYGVMLGLSLVVGWYLTLGLARRDGLGDRETMGSLYIWTAVAAVIGARLLYVVTNPSRFANLIDVFKINQGGLVAYGGFLGGFIGSWIFCHRRGLSLLAWADCAVPSLCTGLMITRVGCFMYGCDFGKPWDGALALRFPAGSPAFNQQRMQGLLEPGATESLPVHPTQFYESLNGLVLFGALMLVRRYRKFSGQMFVTFTMGYAILRYWVEALRADEQRGTIGPVSTSQAIGMGTFLAGAALFAVLYARYRRDPQAVRLWERDRSGEGDPAAEEARKTPASRTASNAARRRRKRGS